MPEPVPWSRLDVDPGRTSGASGLVNLVSGSNEYRTLQGENRDGFCRRSGQRSEQKF